MPLITAKISNPALTIGPLALISIEGVCFFQKEQQTVATAHDTIIRVGSSYLKLKSNRTAQHLRRLFV